MMNLGKKMMRSLVSGCTKFGQRSYRVSRENTSSSSSVTFWTPPEVTVSTPPSGVSLLLTSSFGYLWYQTKASSEQKRLRGVLSQKRNQIRILSRQNAAKRKKVEEAELKLIEKAATVRGVQIQV